MTKHFATLSDTEKEEFYTCLKSLAEEGSTMIAAAASLSEMFQIPVTKNMVQYHASLKDIQFNGGRLSESVPERISDSAQVEADRKLEDTKGQLAHYKRLYKKALESSSLAKKVAGDAVNEVRAFKAVAPPSRLKPEPHGASTSSVVCLNSCLHFGEVVEEESTMGLGNYNTSIAAARYRYYIETVSDLAINHHQPEHIEELIMVNVGDNVSGDIHLELKASNEYPLGAQIVRCAHLIAAGVRDLAAVFPKVKFIGTVGNHGRFDKKPAFKDKYNNSDWIVYSLVAALLKDQPNVTVEVPYAPWYTMPIQGYNFFFTHGDNIRSAFSFPWYDAKRFVTEMGQLLTAKGQPYPEYWGLGQFHQVNTAQLSFGEWLFTGSFKGPDEYSIGKLRAGTPPAQLFFGVHPKHGVTFRYPVVMSGINLEKYDRYQRYAEPEWSPSE